MWQPCELLYTCYLLLTYIALNTQEAVSCFQELGAECLDERCVSVIVNHVVEKCEESRQLAGTLLLQLITDGLLTVDQFVSGSVKHVYFPPLNCPSCLQCFDAVGWVSGRASGL